MEKSIDYVLEVAYSKGITKAAEKLFITPSALSKFILQRERELGIPLFHRRGKEFIPTKAGEVYIERAKELRRLHQELEVEMKGFSDISHGVLRIGIQSSFTELMYRKLLPAFQQKLPGIRIVTSEKRVDELILDLKNHRIDILLAITDFQSEDILNNKLIDCEYVLALRVQHPLSSRAVKKESFNYPWLDVRDFEQLPFVVLSSSSPYHSYRNSLFQSAGVSANDMYQVSSTRTGLTCVAYSNAAMVTLDQMVLQNHFDKGISIYSLGEKAISLSLSYLIPRDSLLIEEIRILVELTMKALLE